MRKLILLASLAITTMSCEKEEAIQKLEINGYELAGDWVSDSSRTINYWDLVPNYDTTSYDSYPANYHLYEFIDNTLLHTWYENGIQSGGSSHAREIWVNGIVHPKVLLLLRLTPVVHNRIKIGMLDVRVTILRLPVKDMGTGTVRALRDVILLHLPMCPSPPHREHVADYVVLRYL